MRYQDNLQPQFNSSEDSRTTSFLYDSLICNDPVACDDLQNELELLRNDLPQQSNEIAHLIRYLNLVKTFKNATPSQKSCLGLHLCGSRKAEKKQFTFYHSVKAYLSNYSEKTMQRGNLFWEKNHCLRKADRKRRAWDKTENLYHKDRMLEPLRIVGDRLFINYVDDSGKKHFLPLFDFIKTRVQELKKLNEKRKSFIEKNLVSQRQCPPNYIVLRSICISTGRPAHTRQKLANSIYIEKKLSAGIHIPGRPKLFPISETDRQKFAWYDEHVTMDAIAVLENMNPKTFSKIHSPVAYMLIVCKNATTGNISWKKPFPKKKCLTT